MNRTRREFLGDSLLAAAAAASAARGAFADDAPAPAGGGKPAGANDRVRVAVIGVNGQGRAHLNWLLRQPDAEVVAICDADRADSVIGPALKMVEKKTGKAPRFEQDLRKIFDDKSIDAVTTATPDHWHALVGIWAMQAGKDVYVEKPVSHNLREGRLLVDWSRKLNRICHAGTQSRSTTGLIEAVAWLRAGNLGKVGCARAVTFRARESIGKCGGDQTPPPTVNHDLWCGPGPLKPPRRLKYHYDWHWFWDYGGSDLLNNGIHQLDVCRWGLGKTEMPGRTVSVGGRYVWDDDGETPNSQLTVYDYGDAMVISDVRNLPTKDSDRGVAVGIVFRTEKGWLVSDKNTHAVAHDPDGGKIREFEGGVEGANIRSFLDAVKSRKREDQCSEILQGHLSTGFCHLGNLSWRLGVPGTQAEARKALGTGAEAGEAFDRFLAHLAKEGGVDLARTPLRIGRALTLDPKMEAFAGDKEADAMRWKEYRTPFVVPECT